MNGYHFILASRKSGSLLIKLTQMDLHHLLKPALQKIWLP